MKKLFLIIAILLSFQSGKAQTVNGVSFIKGLSWQQILNRASAEHKMIFVDCYATWCAPCKQMDALVYPDPQAGFYMNDKFICVKVQIDQSKIDSPAVKAWYNDARMITKTYHITELPTFLYFSSEGLPLHRVTGTGSVQDFIQWAKDAQDSTRQYYAILKNYQPGKLDTGEVRSLAIANLSTDPDLAGKLMIDYLTRGGWENLVHHHQAGVLNSFTLCDQVRHWADSLVDGATLQNIRTSYGYRTLMAGFNRDSLVKRKAHEYMRTLTCQAIAESENQLLLTAYGKETTARTLAGHYLGSLSDQQFLTKDNLLFGGNFAAGAPPSGRLFDFYLRHAAVINQITGIPGYAENVTDVSIYNHLFVPVLMTSIQTEKEPDWPFLLNKVKLIAGASNADRNLANFKYMFYRSMLDRAERRQDPKRFAWGKKLSTATLRKYALSTSGPPLAIGLSGGIGTNNDCWKVFQYSSDTQELRKALQLMQPYMSVMAFADTYANLLYKLGEKPEALEWEKKAIQDAPKDKDIQATYLKMERGEPTWELQNN